MQDKLDIFILGYKDFDLKVFNDCYKIIDGGEAIKDYPLEMLRDNTMDNISHLNGFYSELTRTYWLWKNYPIKDYIGVCHYRRYFSFKDNIPNLDEIFNNNDVILPNPVKLPFTVYKQYQHCHNIGDLELLRVIIKDLYPEYSDSVEYVFNGKELYANNIFIMKKDDFNKYCEFIFSVIGEYLRRMNFSDMESITNYVEKNRKAYLKTTTPNNEVWYQARIGGFLAERLFTIFIKKNFNNPKHYSIDLTLKKYNKNT